MDNDDIDASHQGIDPERLACTIEEHLPSLQVLHLNGLGEAGRQRLAGVMTLRMGDLNSDDADEISSCTAVDHESLVSNNSDARLVAMEKLDSLQIELL